MKKDKTACTSCGYVTAPSNITTLWNKSRTELQGEVCPDCLKKRQCPSWCDTTRPDAADASPVDAEVAKPPDVDIGVSNGKDASGGPFTAEQAHKQVKDHIASETKRTGHGPLINAKGEGVE